MKDPKDFPDKNPLALKAADWLAIFGWWAGFTFALANFAAHALKFKKTPFSGFLASGELLLGALTVFLLGCVVGLAIRAVKRKAPLSFAIYSHKYPAVAIVAAGVVVGICKWAG